MLIAKNIKKLITDNINNKMNNIKTNNKCMKYYDKNKELSYLQYWDVNNLYGWAMSQKLPVNNFEWIKDTFQFNEDFIKNYNEEYPEKLHELHSDLHFHLKE